MLYLPERFIFKCSALKVLILTLYIYIHCNCIHKSHLTLNRYTSICEKYSIVEISEVSDFLELHALAKKPWNWVVLDSLNFQLKVLQSWCLTLFSLNACKKSQIYCLSLLNTQSDLISYTFCIYSFIQLKCNPFLLGFVVCHHSPASFSCSRGFYLHTMEISFKYFSQIRYLNLPVFVRVFLMSLASKTYASGTENSSRRLRYCEASKLGTELQIFRALCNTVAPCMWIKSNCFMGYYSSDNYLHRKIMLISNENWVLVHGHSMHKLGQMTFIVCGFVMYFVYARIRFFLSLSLFIYLFIFCQKYFLKDGPPPEDFFNDWKVWKGCLETRARTSLNTAPYSVLQCLLSLNWLNISFKISFYRPVPYMHSIKSVNEKPIYKYEIYFKFSNIN